ncbi:MAG: ATP-dependent DNA helicase [Desulfomonilaceae bacterium]|nr:ATP-dependent DNA helicase [Desulfomonilaceae bacterium]
MNYREQIEGILGPNGILARSMQGYEHREQQVRMALEVYEAIESGDRLIIEAPTGTGKTLAYLIAASLTRKRVAISTGTKNLQEQLFYKDVPFVKQHVFPGLKAALLKGRANFVCHTRLARYLRQPVLSGIADTGTLQEIVEWYRRTRRSGSGDRAELENLPDDDPIWPEVCSTTETCAGKKCREKDECFVSKMRARAAEADLMIVNHHLLTSDLSVRESGFGEVIPRYEALIVDEAHGLEDAATQHFGFHLSRFRITRLVRDARSEIQESGPAADKYFAALNQAEDQGIRLFALFSDIPGMRERLGAVEPHVAEARDALRKALESLASMLSNVPNASEELRLLAARALEIGSELEIILGDRSRDRKGEYACWAERRERTVMLHASPVDVGDKLRNWLYEKIPAVVFTSATLSSGGNFDYFKSRLGLGEDLEPSETILDSPFDYSRQTMLYIPRSLPEPNAPGFADSLVPVLEQVLVRTQGRAFVLFTSYRNMDTVFRSMEGRVPFPLLVQGSKPKSRLLSEFRERNGSVLFATASFWEGVDVQGDALSCVIVDRLPFAPPNDPIVSARVEKLRKEGKEHFYSFQVPMAVIALKQGLGRLIRTRSDRGILCILDLRILTKSYGKVFRESLYGSPIRRDPRDIEAFFADPSGTSETFVPHRR